MAKGNSQNKSNGPALGFEAQLWAAADKMRVHMDASDYRNEPYKDLVFDPRCGWGGMFVQSEKFVEEHGGPIGDIAVYGQESNFTTWKLARMNLAIHGIDANLGLRNADSFRQDLHPDLKADFILATATCGRAKAKLAKPDRSSAAEPNSITSGFGSSTPCRMKRAEADSSWPTTQEARILVQ